MPSVGEPAPAFTLPGTGGRSYSLADYAGGPVVLVFYPGDGTPVCTAQLVSYNRGMEDLDAVGATVLGISPQGVDSHESFAGRHGFRFPLLADTDKSVGSAYGIIGPLGFYRRSVFVVGGDGVLRWIRRSILGATFPTAGQLAGAVATAS